MDVNRLFQSFQSKNILVIGDVMIDAYMRGSVTRISPEAPVPIVNYFGKREERLGGAANVALNLKALGANAILCSTIGTDDEADRLCNLLKEEGLETKGFVKSEDRMTTVKTRVIGNNQQLIRIDQEQTHDISVEETELMFENIKKLINEITIDAIIFEDYNKGSLTEVLIKKVIEEANINNIPTTVDPKKKNFLAYKNVTLFKPNLKELKEGLGVNFKIENKTEFEEAVNLLRQKLNCKKTFITLSEHGVFLQDDEQKLYVPAHVRNITDVSGAGDTVISVATLCLASGCTDLEIAEISNLAGGLVCESVGVVPINKEQFINEINRLKL